MEKVRVTLKSALESGFSVNKELLVENMEEDTIVAQRIVFDAIQVVGMDVTKIHIKEDDRMCQAVPFCIPEC